VRKWYKYGWRTKRTIRNGSIFFDGTRSTPLRIKVLGPSGIHEFVITFGTGVTPATPFFSGSGFKVYNVAPRPPRDKPPGYIFSVKNNRLKIYVPNQYEAEYAAVRIAHPVSLIQLALQGHLKTSLEHHENMYHASFFLGGLAGGSQLKKKQLIDFFNANHHKKTANIVSGFRGAAILRENPALTRRIIPLFHGLKLTDRARRMLNGGRAVESDNPTTNSGASTSVIQLPSTAPSLFAAALTSAPHHAAAIFNYVAFFYDIVWTNGISSSIRNLYNHVRTIRDIFGTSAFRPRQTGADQDQNEVNNVKDLVGVTAAPTISWRADAGVLGSANGLTPVGGVFGQLRSFYSFNGSEQRFHVRLFNYAGAATPNGVLDAGVLQIYDFSAPITSNGLGSWRQTVGLYFLVEASFPLTANWTGGSNSNVAGLAGQVDEAISGGQKYFNQLAGAFRWVGSNFLSGAAQTFGQLRKQEAWLAENNRKLKSENFGPLWGQMGVYAGLTVTIPFSELHFDQKIQALAAQFSGAVVGGFVGSALAFTFSEGLVNTALGVADVGVESGALVGAGLAALALNKGSVSFDIGSFAYLGLQASKSFGEISFTGSAFGQFNGFVSYKLRDFG
jgi:hypothetical protein